MLTSGDLFEAGYGDGPNRSVLRTGIQLLVENSPHWGCRGASYHPLFSAFITPIQLREFWVAGVWCGIHIIHLGLAPDPITPWWLLAVVYGQEGLPTNLSAIEALDPVSAKTLAPWFQFGESDILASENGRLVQQLLITYLEMHDVCFSSLLPEFFLITYVFSSRCSECRARRSFMHQSRGP
jgi:hypothetical protein